MRHFEIYWVQQWKVLDWSIVIVQFVEVSFDLSSYYINLCRVLQDLLDNYRIFSYRTQKL